MAPAQRGRPRAFDRDQAILAAARLFWRFGYSGTSTRTLTEALGISTSSLYGAFGTKADLFQEAVHTYAERYRQIYEQAIAEDDIGVVLEQILTRSVQEFTQPTDRHPGCLISSAVMTDGPQTLDVRVYLADLHRANERALRARIERAVGEGQLPAATSASTLAGLVQAVWHGLSVQSNLGATRAELLAGARLAIGCFVA
ncbi:TetR/AcrR family transcriptional regulator [Catenulispora sp. NF23]|uniref:TetR/AcrR family transcriptional regulator n=1 Tax=Catenulispora pinistramenti TaxID=2705254 RepID=A0ABS5KXD3_9ACTN|nr:TetR/AcrR family transcriptional regulator [Catenulispora pinistramenti]MBS2539463.1 TetR/AcrR family transcriptional regulator [Catenulispora pinistramenti]MBS2550723.1 TetR/AcrR family transcriptional regulator [Catenulispora pinistramenti]